MEKKKMEPNPKIFKFKPYVGESDEDARGRKTKINFENSEILEYDVCYEQVVKISMISKDQTEEIKDSVRYVEETGVITKDSITNIVKYSKTEYDEEGNPFRVFSLDICNSAVALTFDIETETDRNTLYDKLYNWRFGNG